MSKLIQPIQLEITTVVNGDIFQLPDVKSELDKIGLNMSNGIVSEVSFLNNAPTKLILNGVQTLDLTNIPYGFYTIHKTLVSTSAVTGTLIIKIN